MKYQWWLLVALSLFLVGLVLGVVIPVDADGVLAEELAALRELGKVLTPFTLPMAAFILVKNVSALLLSFAFSPLLCVVPVLSLLLNGGLVAVLSVRVAEETSLGWVLAALLPHGILEIPAFIIGEAAALSFGTWAMIALISPEGRRRFPSRVKPSLRYLAIACGLLVPAAFVETFLTPLLVG